ncbi:MAG: hypothetical protein JWR77_222 [Rhizorhabdus sp.]|nr:hypothetical protein [Rhizorhabdus sp.]
MPDDRRDDFYDAPAIRRLRVYAFDPQASIQLETAAFNVATIQLPWETEHEAPLTPGPVNDYLEVIDYDPVSGQLYEPIDLNNPNVLAQDGLAPSEGDPRFHQQMVFAVAMKTIRAFERALGRRIFWAPRKLDDGTYVPVDRLRVYPHALREANAFYSREKKALLFGYFPAAARDASANWVFTALSHDIVAHETTHAILDGLHRRFAEPTSPDSLAFHEAFADIVALLSHFTLEEAVRSEIAAQGGQLDERSLMSGLAKQFGQATGRAGALRDAVDHEIGATPDPTALDGMSEPHERGAVLVAAVFDAFLMIYHRRTADLMRIANVQIDDKVRRALHPDLVNRLAREASKSAEHVMRMCLRALDYMPPVDVRFGDFLRSIVTADIDLVPSDPLNYRLAMIEGFRRRGVLPEGCLSLAPDSLRWERAEKALSIADIDTTLDFDPRARRKDVADLAERNRYKLWRWLNQSDGQADDADWQRACGVIFRDGLEAHPTPMTVARWPDKSDRRSPAVEVHSVRTTRRTGPDGQDARQLIVEVTQRRRGFVDADRQRREDAGEEGPSEPDFIFRGGSTLIFDLVEKRLRYTITKPIWNARRLEEQRKFEESGMFGGLGATYRPPDGNEPFAMVHRHGL